MVMCQPAKLGLSFIRYKGSIPLPSAEFRVGHSKKSGSPWANKYFLSKPPFRGDPHKKKFAADESDHEEIRYQSEVYGNKWMNSSNGRALC